MAEIRPFRAIRYDEEAAGRLETVVAPPYDVISEDERREYLARSPYNVVHLTLPDSESDAARAFRDWRGSGILATDERPAMWALEQDYVGPDGVRRTRRGVVAALRAQPYEEGVILPHERTHAGPKEGRLRLLRAVRAQLEPIFLLYDGSPPLEFPDEAPLVEAEGAGALSRLWPLGDETVQRDAVEWFARRTLLIADGHHRYETTLAFNAEDGSPRSAFMLAVLVSTEDAGLEIFPTHRVVERLRDRNGTRSASTFAGPAEGLRALEDLPPERPAALLYAHGETVLLKGDEPEPDARFVERLGLEGLSYTPYVDDAVARVDEGSAEAAILLRPPRVADVAALARRGETMPQKSTYFYPKLLSGLLFLALDVL